MATLNTRFTVTKEIAVMSSNGLVPKINPILFTVEAKSEIMGRGMGVWISQATDAQGVFLF
jgi:hypothetical protein